MIKKIIDTVYILQNKILFKPILSLLEQKIDFIASLRLLRGHNDDDVAEIMFFNIFSITHYKC